MDLTLLWKPATAAWSAVTWFWSRPTLLVRIQEDAADLEVGGLNFEVENTSDKATSLAPTVTASYVDVHGKRRQVVFDVREADRSLPPFLPKRFSASAREVQAGRGHGWFRTYAFAPTRGATRRVLIKNASLLPVSYLRFHAERLRFRFTGGVDVRASMTNDQYRAEQRSKGPH